LGFGLVAADLGFGAQGEPVLLRLVGVGLAGAGLVLEVPAVAALLGAQVPGSFRAGRAGRFQRGPAGDDLLVHLPGVEIGPAQLDRAEAAAARFGQDPDRIAG
jgi:hypothetical protein